MTAKRRGRRPGRRGSALGDVVGSKKKGDWKSASGLGNNQCQRGQAQAATMPQVLWVSSITAATTITRKSTRRESCCVTAKECKQARKTSHPKTLFSVESFFVGIMEERNEVGTKLSGS
jgi:hypothetical protein